MILPYSTDAPIYHFPWMTIVLIVVNCVTFGLTAMGLHSDGWLLQYGNGLHPTEWLAYNFLHFGLVHLLGNMFFLWAFGIVVEGKLGWWKFLAIYLGVGVSGGFLIQVAMLGYRAPLDSFASVSPTSPMAWLEPASALGQDAGMDAAEMDEDADEMFPGEQHPNAADDEPLTPEQAAQLREHLHVLTKPGAGGASLVVFALLGIVLVWAPKNEVSCFFLVGFRAGTFEMEYIYFCGLKIVSEIIGMAIGATGYEVTSEVAHVLGAFLGFGIGTAYLKLNWVDCENWDLFAYAQNKHGGVSQVGSWQEAAMISHRHDRKIATPDLGDVDSAPAKSKKRRAKPKLVALESLDDDSQIEEAVDVIEVAEAIEEADKTDRSSKPVANSALQTIRLALKEGRLNDALTAIRRQRATDRSFELPQAELKVLADGFFKAQNVRDSRIFLEEYIRRFPENADRQRVKLAVVYVKFLRSPKAALKLLASVEKQSLSEDYAQIHQQAARQAQQMIADGVTDAI